MVTVASKFFEGVGYRGMFSYRGMLRFTLMRFEDDGNFSAQEQAELWALKLLLRWKSVYAVEG
jgi:hypothetical protein